MRSPRRTEILAVIPARGGSKSVPRKNIRIVAGKPLVCHTIAQALASRQITRTIVSTDDAEIADVARRYGAETPFTRPAQFARDDSPDIDVFRHALEWLRDEEGYECDAVVHLRPTAPVRRVELIDQAITVLLEDPEADSLRSVSVPPQTPYKMWRLAGRYLEPLVRLEGVREPFSMPRQALPPVYWQNGYVDVVRPIAILDKQTLAGSRIIPFVIDEPVPELDYDDDLPQLEAALAALEQGRWPAATTRRVRHSI